MNSSHAKNSKGRGKSQGWAAFDLKQRQKQQQQPQIVVGNCNNNVDPFPPLPTASLRPCENGINAVPAAATAAKSFSSVLLMPSSSSSLDFPSITDDDDLSSDSLVVETNPPDFCVNKLKQLHPWADTPLIQDVLSTFSFDIHKASTFLKDMDSSTANSNRNGDLSSSHDIQSQKVETETTSFLDNTSHLSADIADLSSTLEEALKDDHKHLEDPCGRCLSPVAATAAANLNLILAHLKSLPLEPDCDWEDHDLYLTHRRNALKMMRLASRHSRAATNAFMRGDHFSAQQESMKARKEWLDAVRLNVEAAKEILGIRNSENNPWKLDLHGLHSAEAVQALQEHLKKIETQLPMKQAVYTGRVKTKNGTVDSPVEPFISMDVEELDLQHMRFRQGPASLQVITGVGNHSRGQAALPTAIKNFLNENRYHFDEARPGVISVFPKFRHRQGSHFEF